ncbi:MAG TPA: hypothetical protein VH518_08065 [Tepidisphaeraceae bacterium]|jgi:hypothetical protein
MMQSPQVERLKNRFTKITARRTEIQGAYGKISAKNRQIGIPLTVLTAADHIDEPVLQSAAPRVWWKGAANLTEGAR